MLSHLRRPILFVLNSHIPMGIKQENKRRDSTFGGRVPVMSYAVACTRRESYFLVEKKKAKRERNEPKMVPIIRLEIDTGVYDELESPKFNCELRRSDLEPQLGTRRIILRLGGGDPK